MLLIKLKCLHGDDGGKKSQVITILTGILKCVIFITNKFKLL